MLQKVDDLIGAGKFETVRQVILKELKDAEEVGGPTSRLINYIIAEKLMELKETPGKEGRTTEPPGRQSQSHSSDGTEPL